MSDMEITIKLPSDLVERAQEAGVDIERQAASLVSLIEEQIKRQQAAKRLLEIADQLSALPDEVKPTSEDVETARREFWNDVKEK
ncbi:MAG: hypothetical protein KF726_12660 [Anaerolineae bacterium]|nr:hypothetical protein [Anaerolineae bacterium]